MAVEWFRNLTFGDKTAVVLGCGACIASTVSLVYYLKLKKDRANQDEGFVESPKLDEIQEKRILVLGLDGAGKSRFLTCLGNSRGTRQRQEETKPTEGFNVMCVQTEKVALDIWEIGGKPKVRNYWGKFVQDTDLLVFMVDSSDEKRLPEAYEELHRLLGDERLKKVPILIIANKQDIASAQRPSQIQHALGMDNVSPHDHPVTVLGLSVPPSDQTEGVEKAQRLMTLLVSK